MTFFTRSASAPHGQYWQAACITGRLASMPNGGCAAFSSARLPIGLSRKANATSASAAARRRINRDGLIIGSTPFSLPLSLGEREGPIAQRWEGEGPAKKNAP